MGASQADGLDARALDARVRAFVESGGAPGAAYGVVVDGRLAHAAGVGERAAGGPAPGPRTMFPIASMTKSFTAAATLLARDRGLLDLDEPITRRVPEARFLPLQWRGGAREDVGAPTIRELLSMRGGLTEDNEWFDPLMGTSEEDVRRLVARGVRLDRAPGTGFEYSNLGYALVGMALRDATGESLAHYVQTHVIRPLGLRRTGFARPDARSAPWGQDWARGYEPARVRDPQAAPHAWRECAPIERGAFSAGGGLRSCVADLAVWIDWLGSAFRAPDPVRKRGLARASRRELQTPHTALPPALTRTGMGVWAGAQWQYGFGLAQALDPLRGRIVSHSGGLPGFRSHMCWHPESGCGVVVLANAHKSRGDVVELARGMLDAVLDRRRAPSHIVVPWPATLRMRADVERHLLAAWDDTFADAAFAPNMDADLPRASRRAQVAGVVDRCHPTFGAGPVRVYSAPTPAELTWVVAGTQADLAVRIHLTGEREPRLQEFAVDSLPHGVAQEAIPLGLQLGRGERVELRVDQRLSARVDLPGVAPGSADSAPR